MNSFPTKNHNSAAEVVVAEAAVAAAAAASEVVLAVDIAAVAAEIRQRFAPIFSSPFC